MEVLLKSLIECAICCDYLENLLETPCCHNLFCKTCIVAWSAASNSCPACRKRLAIVDCGGNIPIQRFLDRCEVRPNRADLEKHRNLCPFSLAAMEGQRSEKNKQLRASLKEIVEKKSALTEAEIKEMKQKMIEIAQMLIEVGDYSGAAEAANWIIKTRCPDATLEMQAVFILALAAKAEAHYEKALTYFEDSKKRALKAKNSHDKIVDCLVHIGEIYVKMGKYAEAEMRFNEALAMKEMTTLDKTVIGELYNFLGLIAKKRSDYQKAISNYRSALEVVGADKPIWFELISNLADVHRKKENFKEARELYTQALQKVKEIYGENHPQIAEISNALGMLNKKEGKYEEALTCYKTALQIGKFFFGSSHPSIGMYLTNLGDIYRKQGNFNKAEGIYSQALPMLENTLGKEHAEVAEVLNSMGLVLKKRADYDGAEKLYKRAIKIIEDAFGGTHYKIGIYLNNLADIDRKRAKFELALEKYKKALSIVEKHLGKEHSEAAEILFRDMGLVQHQIENYNEAIKLFLSAYSIVEKELGQRCDNKHYKIGMILNNLGLSEMMKNNYDTLNILIECLGREHVEVADCYVNLGDVCMKLTQERKQNRVDEAKTNYKNAQRILEKAFGSTHTKCQQLESLLFICDMYDSLAG